MKEEIEIKYNVSLDEFERKIKQATQAAERLKASLEELNQTKIYIEVTEKRKLGKRWYQFWE